MADELLKGTGSSWQERFKIGEGHNEDSPSLVLKMEVGNQVKKNVNGF